MEIPPYITEINKFYDWLETNQLPKSAIALWHGLMHINNKAGWDRRFTVAISTIESKTGFKRSELFEARNILEQKGRLKWKQRGGNLCAEYELIFFCVRTADASMDTSADAKAYTKGNTKPTQTGTIKRLDKTRTSSIEEVKEGGEPPPTYSQDELDLFKNFETYILKNAATVSKMKIPFTIEQYLELKKKFSSEQIKQMLLAMHNYVPLVKKNASAYLTFLKWMSADKKNQPQNGQHRQSIADRQAANLAAATESLAGTLSELTGSGIPDYPA